MSISLTQRAVERIRQVCAAHGLGQGWGLRVGVNRAAQGTERFILELDEGPSASDRSWPTGGLPVFCDPKTYLFLGRLEIDFNPDRGGFIVREGAR